MSRQPAAATAMRLQLVAVVHDGDQILACRDHDTGVWRLPSTPWNVTANPVQAMRELLADRAALTVSPTLHAPVRLSATAGLLLFIGKPLNTPPAGTRLCRWLSPRAIAAVLPPDDQRWVSLTSTPVRRRHTPPGRHPGWRHLIVVTTSPAAAPQAG